MAAGSSVRLHGPIYRFEVPVDDMVHEIVCGQPLHVESLRARVVEFWADSSDAVRRQFTVLGTGQPLPDQVLYYWGTVRDVYLPWHLPSLVWHLVEVG